MKTLRTSAAVALAAFSFTLSAQAGPAAPPLQEPQITLEDESPWSFELVPYLWGANLDGTVGVGGITSALDIGFDDILDNLDMAVSALFGVRYNRVGLLADFMYVKVSPSFETPGPLYNRTDLAMKTAMFDLKGTYRVYETERAWLDILAGARYYRQDLSLTLQPGLAPGRSASGHDGWWDAVGGIRGQVALTDKWFLTYLADIGGGSSDLTWQAMGGIGYRFNDLVHASLVYRYMSYDYSNDDFFYDVDTGGIGIGLGFTW